MITITYIHDNYYIWSAQDADVARREHRIVGALIGALPSQPNQNNQFGLPMKLMKEEVCLLVDKKFANIIRYGKKKTTEADIKNYEDILFESEMQQKILTRNDSFEPLIQLHTRIPENFKHMFEILPVEKPLTSDHLSYLVFQHFWEEGKFVTSGFKFGGHFLVYLGDPSRYHSEYIVYIVDPNLHQQIIEMNLLRLYRLAFNVKKKVVVCSMSDNQVELDLLTIKHPLLNRIFTGIDYC